MNQTRHPPLRILIAALGGEGGGTLMNWILAAARATGRKAQSTSVPGVAQRTGSTSYYLEIVDSKSTAVPVLSLVPLPARVDVVVASELVEAARCLAAGFVSPKLTTLVASTSRVYSTAEKIALGDGRYGAENIRNAAEKLAKNHFLLDLDQLAIDNNTYISATLFGALSGSGVLPWADDISRAAMGQGAYAEASRRGFDAAADAVKALRMNAVAKAAEVADRVQTAPPNQPEIADLETLPKDLRTVLSHGLDRVIDFQDKAYGQIYMNHVGTLLAVLDFDDHRAVSAVTEGARRLALWMAYEDVARVADLKTRPERFARIRDEAQVQPGQILWVTEYLKPRVEEIADILPEAFGRWILQRVKRGGKLPFLGRGIQLNSNGILGFRLLRLVASLRHIRRRSLRFKAEQVAIVGWLQVLEKALKRDVGFASGLAELPRLLKGYSETQQRGKAAYGKIIDGIVTPALKDRSESAAAPILRQAISAALADEDHKKLDQLLAGEAERSAVVGRPGRHADVHQST